MKKIYFLTAVSALAFSGAAQQIQNPDFEGGWSDCIPWTFYQNDENFGQPSEVVTGVNPNGWVISNVSGMASYYDYEGQGTGLGATIVGESVAGYESENAVKLTNSPNPFMPTQIVPAYLTLGTTWSTANPAFDDTFNIVINKADGGVFGGVPFTGRPSGIEFMYKRTAMEVDEPATVVAYLWKGHWTQKDVPAIIYMAGEPYCTEMTDRDRCVLGMDLTGMQGGEVTATDDAELIAVINTQITAVSDDWMKFTADFDYKSEATPEYINIILSAGDYFSPANEVVQDNSLIVDNVKLIYAGAAEADVYAGKLSIEMGGSSLTEDPLDAELYVAYGDGGVCTITLPNFNLNGMALGDIVVTDVAVSVDGNVASYTGQVQGMELMDGMIKADVDVNGTINGAGEASFLINVMWEGVPVVCTFNGTGKPAPGTSAVNVNVADDAETEFYNLNGMRVLNPANGVFIKRQGNKVTKVVVK